MKNFSASTKNRRIIRSEDLEPIEPISLSISNNNNDDNKSSSNNQMISIEKEFTEDLSSTNNTTTNTISISSNNTTTITTNQNNNNENDNQMIPENTALNSNTISFTSMNNSQKDDYSEIKYMMDAMEELRIKNPDNFYLVINNSRQILDIVKSNDVTCREDVAIIDNLFKQVENIDIDYLFWCSNKCIRIAAIENKNLLLVHYFVVAKGYKLYNKSIYQNFLNYYIISLKNFDFINGPTDKCEEYIAILQMLISNGEVDINDNEIDEIQNTPLHYAVANKQLPIIIILVKYKQLDINKTNIHGFTPLDFAVEELGFMKDITINEAICQQLLKHGGKTRKMTNTFNKIFELKTNDDK